MKNLRITKVKNALIKTSEAQGIAIRFKNKKLIKKLEVLRAKLRCLKTRIETDEATVNELKKPCANETVEKTRKTLIEELEEIPDEQIDIFNRNYLARKILAGVIYVLAASVPITVFYNKLVQGGATTLELISSVCTLILAGIVHVGIVNRVLPLKKFNDYVDDMKNLLNSIQKEIGNLISEK